VGETERRKEIKLEICTNSSDHQQKKSWLVFWVVKQIIGDCVYVCARAGPICVCLSLSLSLSSCSGVSLSRLVLKPQLSPLYQPKVRYEICSIVKMIIVR
jgi:hypothetical protein